VTTTKATVTGNWWDSLGKPQYGGQIAIRLNRNPTNFDPIYGNRIPSIETAWLERLFADDWKLNPSVFDFRIGGRPSEYEQGLLAQTWEFTDTTTFTVHIRQGVRWQDIPPVSGREFVASDVAYHYNRMLGLGDGFTKPVSAFNGFAAYIPLRSVTATDKYTVVFKWANPTPESIIEAMMRVPGTDVDLEAREAVNQWGDLSDWRHAIGTGPWLLKDYVSDSSSTLEKNPNYWGYDERYPQNKLPYANTLRILVIPDTATALAGLRSGKIDVMEGIQFTQAQSITKTNPEILQLLIPTSSGLSIDPRNDNKPMNDIRVRKAMQMSLNLADMAKSYYNGNAEPYPSTFVGRYLAGWGFKYEDWPQDLKDEYAYNPTGAKKLLADAGYPTGFKTNVVADLAGDMDLLQIVKSYFSAVGIDMEIRTMDSVSWTSFVTALKADQLTFRGGSSILGTTDAPVLQLGGFRTGYAANWYGIADPAWDALTDKALAATSIADAKAYVKEASEKVTRQHWIISLLQPRLTALYQPWLKGYNGQDQSVSGLVTPRLLCFYEARFWIDQNLKTSLGK
jgi:peptide/nickel transport system substrate-binding protein